MVIGKGPYPLKRPRVPPFRPPPHGHGVRLVRGHGGYGVPAVVKRKRERGDAGTDTSRPVWVSNLLQLQHRDGVPNAEERRRALR